MLKSNAWTIQRGSDAVATLWFDRPGSSQNALDGSTLEELDERLTEIETLADLRGLVIRSAKLKGFCAGADLKAIRRCQTAQDVESLLRLGWRAFDHLTNLEIPTLAVVHGTCLGGGLELALACDSIVAIDLPESQLGTPEIKLGLIPGWGAIPRVCQRVGFERGISMLLTGQPVDAGNGLQCGLVDALIQPDALDSEIFTHLKSSPRPRSLEFDVLPVAYQESSVMYGRDSVAEYILALLNLEIEAGPEVAREATIATLASMAVTDQARAAMDALFTKRA